MKPFGVRASKGERTKTLLFLLLAFLFSSGGLGAAATRVRTAMVDSFQDDFIITWGYDHVMPSSDGQALCLMLDNSSGSSMASKKTYLYGTVSMEMKLVPGDSAGVVTAYYMASSNTELRDELDFEFLGNVSGEPYILQTNVYAHGVGGREQRIYLWFDPTQDFHAYTLTWNPHNIIFSVDDVPIRVFNNLESKGVPFPNRQAMGIYSSIWNGDEWATQGGSIKINWDHAPFIASYRGFLVNACDAEASECSLSVAPSSGRQASLSASQLTNLEKVKKGYMVYDYCADSPRYTVPPTECAYNP
ncbi:hypothetical protein KP509_23G002100 [Ceratopteris richardii]|uniref:Xyloglucan endotransglucosylase/hydrolase n=1 Tax=Ceratopteris richardii TaxID=49495 RepID=A0A8T2RZ39_CERRI|nr:hypothetical protein KP509_23G002100 [Ceratopteris richardii]